MYKVISYGGLFMNKSEKIRTKLKCVAAISCLIPVTFLHSITNNYFSGNDVSIDFQRLQWLCTDYGLNVEGYVIEGWFQFIHIPGMERFLEEQLQLDRGYHKKSLIDGSIVSTDLYRKDNKWQATLQLISKDPNCIAQYYSRWQNFADKYCHKNPVGITVIAQLPEQLDGNVCCKLAKEITASLEVQTVSEISTERYTQHSGFSRQLTHNIRVNGQALNSSVTIVPEQNSTYLYIASPILYQQI